MKKKLRIALFTPFEQTAPPPPNVIRAPQELWALLADQLVLRGHDVTLFAPKGSKTKARMPAHNFPPLARHPSYRALEKSDTTMSAVKVYRTLYNELVYAEFAKVFRNFDLVHSVFIAELLPIAAHQPKPPVLFTFHDPLAHYKVHILKQYQGARHLHFNSISRAQQSLFPSFRYDGVVYNGMELKKYPFYAEGGTGLVCAGRMRKTKGPHIAVQIAKKLGLSLTLAGESFPDEAAFFNQEIAPHLSKKIRFIGMQPRKKMPRLYGNAKITVMPIGIPESFGLVMTESMAAGTPVIAFDCGSPREIIKHGKTGFIVKNEKEMAAAVKKIYDMPQEEYKAMRRACREHVEQNFSMERMVENYEILYHDIVSKHKKS